jgi:glucose-1-phosphate cytidylyltransferase
MQTVLLCGGSGTRLREMTEAVPKGLILIGGRPIVWHIMKHYAQCGYGDFVLALGYKQEKFKEYFANFNYFNHDTTFFIGERPAYVCHGNKDEWSVTLVNTGEHTLKGGRLKRIQTYIKGDTFLMAYGDSVSDVNINELVKFHKSHKKIVTITGVNPKPRFGEILHKNGKVISYKEKPEDCGLINGGFMVLNRKVFDYLDEDCDFEKGPLEEIAKKGQLMVYHHKGFWGCCDTLFDMIQLQEQWDAGEPKWRTWDV